MVTGESLPVAKRAGDAVIGSTINKTGTFMFRATKVGSDTLLSQIVEMVKKAQVSRAPIQKTAYKMAAFFIENFILEHILRYARTYFSKNHQVRTDVKWEKEDNLRNQPRS